jgi:hypothetical protein
MYNILRNISRKTPQDVVRKLLYEYMKQAFEDIDAQFDELCNCLYAEIINPDRSGDLFRELLDTLLLSCKIISEYTIQQKEVIGIDKDHDIKFIKDKLVNYQLTINELKGGINDRRNSTIRFTPCEKRNLIIPQLDKFLSLTKEIEEILQILYEAYFKLDKVLHPSPNDSEQVLNRFNKHFDNVKNHIADRSSFLLDFISSSGLFLNFSIKQEHVLSKRTWLSGVDAIPLQNFVHAVVEKHFGKEFYDVYDKPLELAQKIQEKELDNEQVNTLFAMVVMVGDQHRVNKFSSRPRGRPPSNFCYVDYVEQLKEILDTCPVNPNRKLKRSGCRLFFDWFVALFVTWEEFARKDLYGHISAFHRLFKQLCSKIPFGLRYLQMKIKEFKQYLHEKLKGGFFDIFDEKPTRSWARKLKRFVPLEMIKEKITAKFIQFQLA